MPQIFFDEDSVEVDRPDTLASIEHILKHLAKDKSPNPSECTIQFYLHFFDLFCIELGRLFYLHFFNL